MRKHLADNARKYKVGNDKIEKDDVLAGLTAVLTVRLAEPQFEGQTKEILGTPGGSPDRVEGRGRCAEGSPGVDRPCGESSGGRSVREGRL